MTKQIIVQDVDMRLEGVRAVDMPFAFSRADRTWYDKYKIETVPLLVRAKDGKKYDDRRFKGIFIDGKFRRIVSRYYIVYPNEEVDQYLRDNAQKLNLELRATYKSHFGDAMHWELLSKDIDEHIEYKGKDDAVKVGIVVNNSVGTNVGLGADMFTWRVSCENGAVARGAEMGFALRHIGAEPQKFIDTFTSSLEKLVARTKELIEYYQKMAHLRMNNKIAKELAKKIPVKSFPNCMAYDYKTQSTILTRQDDLWTTFNDVTKKVWHSDKAQYDRKAKIEKRLHTVLINAVNGKYD